MKRSFGVALTTLVLLASLCFADDNLTNQKLTTTIQDQGPRTSVVDKLYVNYFSVYHGASLTDAGNHYTLDRFGATNKVYPTNLDSDLTMAYMATKDIGIGPDVPFLIVPQVGRRMILGDVGIKAFNKNTVNYNGFKLYTNIILQAPTSTYSQSRSMDFAVKTTPYFWYAFPHSDFKLGSWTEAKAYVGVNNGKTFKLYADPYVNYRLSEVFSLNLSYEMEAAHYVNKPTFDFVSYQTDLQPGFIWNITPRIMVNPYVQLFTGSHVTWDNSALGAVINATLL